LNHLNLVHNIWIIEIGTKLGIKSHLSHHGRRKETRVVVVGVAGAPFLFTNDCIQTMFQTCILWKLFQTLFIGSNSIIVPFESMQCSALARISLGEIGIKAQTSIGVLKSLRCILLLQIGSTAIAVIDMVGTIQTDGFRVVLNGLRRLASLESSIALVFGLTETQTMSEIHEETIEHTWMLLTSSAAAFVMLSKRTLLLDTV
jgi:hypothetical protein